ncbi:M1 family aminopeptidase [Tellurirhabdus rosea]|uniref:M1 family aminopeptidase n=1 Tax=Tellurirhabdus rosea TaxID=2674997 RepID=UPI00225946EE|nr:M1 family aminopeptidase [Tellurirhabdus rosea]
MNPALLTGLQALLALTAFFGLTRAAYSQSVDDASEACRTAKVRAFGRLVPTSAQARMQYPGDPGIDVHYYKLDLRLTHSPQYLRGAVTVGLRPVSGNVTQFYLDFNDTLRVDSVRAGAVRVAFSRSRGQLIIRPERALAANASYFVTVYYQGRPDPSGLGSFAFSFHGPQRDPAIWSLSEPYGARDWFPCKDTPADKADSSDVWITAPRFFVSVSNGRLEGVSDNPDDTRTYRWRSRYPIAPYLISLAMSNYTQVDQTFGTMPVMHYLYPESATTSVRGSLDETTAMLSFFSDFFGPYPFLNEKYGHAQFGWGGGMEHQTISSMGGFTRTLIAHELAHQWFGDKITCRTWEHIWLNEGFASYAEALFTENIAGKAAFQSAMTSFLNRARNAQGTLYVQDIGNANNIFNSNRTYAKGAAVLHMLRGLVGDQTFRRILREYASSNLAYGTAVTEDFEAIASRVYGQSLGYFFKQWVYGENYPIYTATGTVRSGNASQWTLSLRLQQRTGTTNPGFFTMPVPVRITTTAGDTTVTVFNNAADQTFELLLRAAPTGFAIDPDNWILKQVESTQLQAITGLQEPVAETAIRVVPNPVREQLTVRLETPYPLTGRFSLTDLLGREVAALPERVFPEGRHQVEWPVAHLAAGRYTLVFQTGKQKRSQPVLLVK